MSEAPASEPIWRRGPALAVRVRPPKSDGPLGGARILLVHGTMDRATSFTRLASHLPDATVVSYDRRGYAGSHGVAASTRFIDQVDDLETVIDGQPVLVAVGHSFGGNIVLAAAARLQNLIGSVVVWEAPTPWATEWPAESVSRGAMRGQPPEQMAEHFMRRMVGNRVWERLPTATQALRRAEGATMAAEMEALRAGAPYDPSDVIVPVIVGHGTESRPHHRRGAEVLAATLPRGGAATIEGSHHGVHISHPGELAALVRRAASLATPTLATPFEEHPT